MDTPFTDDDAASMFIKLRDFAATLTDGERMALNHLGVLARSVATDDVEGFSIVPGTGIGRGGRRGAGAGGSSSGGTGGSGGSSGSPNVFVAPSPGGPVPIPYPNFGAGLASFPW